MTTTPTASFNALVEELAPQLQPEDGAVGIAARNGHRLVHNQIREFETGNLAFVESGIEALQLPPAQAVP